MNDATWPIVTLDDDGIRPGGPADACFYCRARVGEPHGRECVSVDKKVRVRYIFEIEIAVPHFWTAHDVEFHRNDSSWCADNAIDDLEEASGEKTPVGAVGVTGPCLCNRFRAEFIEVVADTPICKNRTPEQVAIDSAMRAALGRGVEPEH